LIDLGDFVGVSGHLFRTRTGELTASVAELTLLSKRSCHCRKMAWTFRRGDEVPATISGFDCQMNAHAESSAAAQIIPNCGDFSMLGDTLEKVKTPMMQSIPVARPPGPL